MLNLLTLRRITAVAIILAVRRKTWQWENPPRALAAAELPGH